MRRHEKRMYGYGLFWGIVAFAVGALTTYQTLPKSVQVQGVEKWKMATYVWLNAHGITISGQALTNSIIATQSYNFIRPTPELHMLRVLPLFTAAIAALLVVNSMKGARNDGQLIRYSTVAAGGYISAGVLAVVVTNAKPGAVTLLAIIGALGIAAYLGSTVANRLNVPVFAVTSLGGLAAVGILILVGLTAVSAVAIPIGKYSVVGVGAATVAIWVGDNIDI